MRSFLGPSAALLAIALPACGRPDPQPEPVGSATAAAVRAPAPASSGETWNAAQIAWQGYEAGLAQAKAQSKPVCLVFSTGWCPHCRNYSHVFEDPKIVERARDFVMIHLDADQHRELARKYAPDGGYVPRTFFLAPDGTLDPEVHAPRPRYLYFFDERNPASLLAGMNQMLAKLRR